MTTQPVSTISEREASEALTLGLLAPELPPMLGGMSELSRCLGRELARRGHRVRVFAHPEAELPGGTERAGALSRRPWADLAALRRADSDVDVWLAMNAGLAPLGPRLETPFAVYLHGNDFLQPWLACGPPGIERIRRPVVPRIRMPLRRRAIGRALRRVDRVLTNSRQTRDRIVERFAGAPLDVEVHVPGVDDLFFQPHDPVDLDAPPRLLTVSRLTAHTRRKNVDGVLRALALLRAEGGVAPTYEVVGDGDDRPRLQALAASLGLGETVSFLGAVSRDELLAAYRRADLFVLASRATDDDVEGFGIVYMEASAAGTPVLASRAGGAIDAVDVGENGLLVDRSDPESLAAALRAFADTRERFTAERVRAVAERHRWPVIAAGVERTLASIA